MSIYEVYHRVSHITRRVRADNAVAACRRLGWMIGDCYVHKLTERRLFGARKEGRR